MSGPAAQRAPRQRARRALRRGACRQTGAAAAPVRSKGDAGAQQESGAGEQCNRRIVWLCDWRGPRRLQSVKQLTTHDTRTCSTCSGAPGRLVSRSAACSISHSCSTTRSTELANCAAFKGISSTHSGVHNSAVLQCGSCRARTANTHHYQAATAHPSPSGARRSLPLPAHAAALHCASAPSAAAPPRAAPPPQPASQRAAAGTRSPSGQRPPHVLTAAPRSAPARHGAKQTQ